MLQHRGEVLQHTVSHAIGITATVRVAILCWQNVLARHIITRIEQGYKLFCLLQLSSPQNMLHLGDRRPPKTKSENHVIFNSQCCTSCLALWKPEFYIEEDCMFLHKESNKL